MTQNFGAKTANFFTYFSPHFWRKILHIQRPNFANLYIFVLPVADYCVILAYELRNRLEKGCDFRTRCSSFGFGNRFFFDVGRHFSTAFRCRLLHFRMGIATQIRLRRIGMERLTALYQQHFGAAPSQVVQLAGAGSNRAYYRLSDASGKTVIGVVGTSIEENRAFIYLSRHFKSKNLPVPDVLAVSDDQSRYLQTDLGELSLYDAIRTGREQNAYNDDEIALLEKTIRALPALQFKGAEGLDWSVCYPQPTMDQTNVMFDLNYFKYCFLKLSGIDFHEMKLEETFHALSDDILALPSDTFLYRDCQARNIMLVNGCNPYFIDYQGGRRGSFYYDLASFLWQASAHYSDELRERLAKVYYQEAQHFTTLPPYAEFQKNLRLFAFFRTLQVLGAYGFRGYHERKQYFIQSIPAALNNLRDLLPNDSRYAYLAEIAEKLQAAQPKPMEKHDNLVVRIFSFSYRKGIPADESGNGGGYVFDCRSTHNPGRYEPYKKLTGLDAEVIKFLEDDGEITDFLAHVYAIADHHVARYLERGFTDLMFSFGCTGGQHRSVYSAQHLAEHLHEKFGVEVHLVHRERGIKQTFPQKKS